MQLLGWLNLACGFSLLCSSVRGNSQGRSGQYIGTKQKVDKICPEALFASPYTAGSTIRTSVHPKRHAALIWSLLTCLPRHETPLKPGMLSLSQVHAFYLIQKKIHVYPGAHANQHRWGCSENAQTLATQAAILNCSLVAHTEVS